MIVKIGQKSLKIAKQAIKTKILGGKIAIELGYVGLLYADAPQHPRQKYYLTEKGKAVLEQITTQKCR